MAYTPEPIGGVSSLEDLTRYVQAELSRIQDAFYSPQFALIVFEQLHRPPEKLREGMFVYADGINWNPGDGAGLYWYHASQWFRVAESIWL